LSTKKSYDVRHHFAQLWHKHKLVKDRRVQQIVVAMVTENENEPVGVEFGDPLTNKRVDVPEWRWISTQ
jgi:hypothetical protein